ncbi:MAG: TatD family hydrolase [Firmicutes bacterium]|nr:TatD family hydrolase [Bacillota bacterium]
MIVDTHAHLDDEVFAGKLDEVLERARAAGVGMVINPGYNIESSQAAVWNAATHAGVFATVGIHPHDASSMAAGDIETLSELLDEPKVVAIGEIGLDYYRDLSPRDRQVAVFRDQLALARERGVPVVVHNRDAHHDTLKILREFATGIPKIVMHCFSASAEMAREFMRLGCYISIAGPVTYPKAPKLAEVVRHVPLTRMLVETDSPYMAPVPHRGRPNEPAYVSLVVQKISQLKEVLPEDVARQTSANADAVFGLSSW